MPETQNNTIHKNGYRPNVGLMILNLRYEVFMGQRRGSWDFPYQMPQGGIDAGETPRQAAWRELWEETGLTDKECDILCESKNWYQYDIPQQVGSSFKGQTQKWFLFLMKKEAPVCLTHQNPPEFEAFKWVVPNQVIDLIVPFKKEVYKAVFQEFDGAFRLFSADKELQKRFFQKTA